MQQIPSSEANGRSVSQEITVNLFSSSQEFPFASILRQTTQSQSHHFIFLKFILILPSHLGIVLPSGLFPSVYPTKTPNVFTFLHTLHMPRPSHPP